MHEMPQTRPGWLEIGVGLLGIAIFGIGLAFAVIGLPLDPVTIGLIMTAVSGIGGFAGFFMAFGLRIRRWEAFGIRRTTLQWLLAAVAAGLIAFLAKSIAIVLYVAATGDASNLQEVYAQGGSGGLVSLVVATLFLTLLTPLGEEFLFAAWLRARFSGMARSSASAEARSSSRCSTGSMPCSLLRW